MLWNGSFYDGACETFQLNDSLNCKTAYYFDIITLH